MPLTVLFALAAALPEMPASAVQALQEGDVYVVRNLIDNTPLYTFDADQPGKSNCNDACAATWRPLWALENATPVGRWTLVKRDDGSTQWAYDDRPVYSFAREPAPVALGGGKVGTWHLLPTFPTQ